MTGTTATQLSDSSSWKIPARPAVPAVPADPDANPPVAGSPAIIANVEVVPATDKLRFEIKEPRVKDIQFRIYQIADTATNNIAAGEIPMQIPFVNMAVGTATSKFDMTSLTETETGVYETNLSLSNYGVTGTGTYVVIVYIEDQFGNIAYNGPKISSSVAAETNGNTFFVYDEQLVVKRIGIYDTNTANVFSAQKIQ